MGLSRQFALQEKPAVAIASIVLSRANAAVPN
jgi:hypothetical protein